MSDRPTVSVTLKGTIRLSSFAWAEVSASAYNLHADMTDDEVAAAVSGPIEKGFRHLLPQVQAQAEIARDRLKKELETQ